MNTRRLLLSVFATALGVLTLTLTLAVGPALAAREYHPGIPSSFGSAGSEPGQFDEPSGLAVNNSTGLEPGAGDVYVLDRGNKRVERFGAGGEYKGQFNGGGEFEVEGKKETGAAAPTGSFSFETSLGNGIAVDNSGKTKLEDPSAGDVYVVDSGHRVVDEFSALGGYEGQLTGTCEKAGSCPGKAIPFLNVYGVAVDPSGNLWVSYANAETGGKVYIAEFTDTGGFVKAFNSGEEGGFYTALAVDSNDVYFAGGRREIDKFDSQTGGKLANFDCSSYCTGAYGVAALAVSPSTDDLSVLDYPSTYEETNGEIEIFGPGGEPYSGPLEVFPFKTVGELEEYTRHHISPKFRFAGVAVGSTGTLYASVGNTDGSSVADVEIFEDVSLPEVEMAVATEVGPTEDDVTLHGSFNPEGASVSECRFEYVSEAAFKQTGWTTATTTECEPPAASIAGSSPVAIQTKLKGLEARAKYDVRLVVVAAGKARSGEFPLFTSTRPLVEGESSSNVGSTGATVSAKIDPSGLPTSYRVEYGTSGVEELSTPEVSVGAATAPVNVSVSLSGLRAGSGYRFRFIASNSVGATPGEEATLVTSAAPVTSGGVESTCPNRTFPGFNAALPDCRAYELVSDAEDEIYVPHYDDANYTSTGEIGGIAGHYRAAASGEAVTYDGASSASGVGGSGQTSNGAGNQYLSVRGAKGWEASDIELPLNSRYGIEYEAFSADLSVVTLKTNSPEVSAEPAELAECAGKSEGVLYSRTATGLHALVTMNQGSGACGAESAGISADDSHILLQSQGAYTVEAKRGTEVADMNLYDSVGGVLHQVNILPGGKPEQQPDAVFGWRSRFHQGEYEDSDDVVSADGSRVFWTALEGSSSEPQPKALYVRENDAEPQSPVAEGRCTVAADACTVLIAEGGQFWTASSEGSEVFYTKAGDLYEFDVETEQTTDLAPGGSVQGVIGASEDGSYVYFVADSVLAGANAEGKAPAAGQPNLYMSHGGGTTLVATLAAEDDVFNNGGGGERELGDWRVDPGARTAEVAPGGHAVGFMSRLPLTGYDNELAGERVPEVFVYEVGAGRIFCVSCNPSGAPPTGKTQADRLGGMETSVGTSGNASFMLRWVNEREGAQVYFMTYQPLVADDTNGLQDVYEWESDGSGGCRQAVGCVVLLSSADPLSSAYFVDASANGSDVFFTSGGQLVAGAIDETLKLYDARVDGGIAEASLACTGTGCQGVPPAPPIFATPSSVTFSGVGNFEPSPPPVVKPKPKSKKPVRCGRGFHRKHNRCVRSGSKKAKGSAKRSSATGRGR
jgi:hypothetical protein